MAHTTMSMTIHELVTLLQKASDAYYNGTGTPLGDDQYDALREQLETRDPRNPFLRSVGAPVQKGAVRVPYKMASLNKIKPGTGSVESFVASSSVKRWVLSDKLDGISVLWIPSKKKLYLRGDGLMGVDVSPFAPYLHGLYPRGYKGTHVIRGELVLPTNVPVEGTLPRSWVNGQLHQKTPIPEQLGKIHFVAYEVLHPSTMARKEQFQILEELGFEVPWYATVSQINDASLSSLFKERRAASPYGIDGIVIGEDAIPLKDTSEDVTNPKDMRAFKMPLDDQRATTQVVDVLWSASYQGYWIPRIQIEPVFIGGSRIEFLTGHNARVIVQQKIGKGSTIVIRKSGDVIPTLETVLVATGPIALPEGEWDGDATTASHYKVKSTGSVAEMTNKRLEHFAKTLDIPHLGPGLVAKLVAEGKESVLDLVTIEKEDLEICVGKGMAAKIFPAIQERLAAATEMDFMVASGEMPRGVGATKLKSLFDSNPDPKSWSTLQSAAGWSKDALQEFLLVLPRYELWRKTQLPMIPYPRLLVAAPLAVAKPAKVERFCFTGFRDAEAEKSLIAKGHEIGATLSGKTTILVVATEATLQKGSEKITKAQDLKTVRILTRDQMKQEYL
jgi:NAD-dependent DNA ligase